MDMHTDTNESFNVRGCKLGNFMRMLIFISYFFFGGGGGGGVERRRGFLILSKQNKSYDYCF